MISDLTDYLRSLGAGGEPPGRDDYEAAKELLRAILVREMVRRGLWSAPPSYLGVSGADCWRRELLDELVADAYVEIFLRRLAALQNQLLVRADVGGVIVRCVRQFLHDRQRDNDPLGYKVYEILRDSLSRLLEAGTLRIGGADRLDGRTAGKARIHNGTVCAFGPDAGFRQPDRVDFEDRVRLWNDELWPELLTAQGRARTRVHERLDDHLVRLGEIGVESFYFKDLVEPMKRDVRGRWSEELANLAEEMASSREAEGGPGFRQLRDCVLGKLQKEPAGTRENLRKLWLFLWSYAAGLNPSEVAAKAERAGAAPADLGLARDLGIGRHLIPPLKATLGRLIRACQSAVSSIALVKEPMGERSKGPGMNPSGDERLREATGQAAGRWAAARDEIERDPRPPRPGDLFVLGSDSELLVEWLVVEEDKERGRLLAQPVDDWPEVGSRDVAIRAEDGGALRRVHCAAELWLEAGVLDLRWRTGQLSAEILDEVRSKRSAIADGSLASALREQEVDDDPGYRRRSQELGEMLTALESPRKPSARIVAFRTRSWRRGRFPVALAASILLSVVLGGGLLYQQRRFASLEGPHLNLPVFWLTADDLRRGEDDPLVVLPEARRVAWLLEVASPEPYPRYRVEIYDGAHAVWSSNELIKSGSELSFDLPRSLLTTGPYELRIYGLPATEPAVEGGPEVVPELLEKYSVWIKLE